MDRFQKLWAPIAAIIGAVLLVLQLGQAFTGNRSLFTGSLILTSLIAIGAGMWNYAFAPSVIKGFPKYKYHWAAKLVLLIIFFSSLASTAYILTILTVIPDCCGFLPTSITAPDQQGLATGLPSTELQLNQWSMDYFSNINLDPPVTYHMEQPAEQNVEGGYIIQINSADLHSNAQIPLSNFSARFSGLFYFDGGYYEFHCEHHDGCRVYVDGKNWIDAWWDGGGGHDLARDIPTGNHIVSIEFYDKSGLGLLEVYWRIKP